MSDAVPKGRRPVGIMKTQLCKELKEAFSQQTEFAASVVASDSAVQALLTTEEGWRQADNAILHDGHQQSIASQRLCETLKHLHNIICKKEGAELPSPFPQCEYLEDVLDRLT